MRPLTALTGIVLGSCVATTFGLAATLVVFMFLTGEHPQFQSELPMLALYVAIFASLTVLAGISFVGLARQRPWRLWAQVALWAALVGLAALYWSTRA